MTDVSGATAAMAGLKTAGGRPISVIDRQEAIAQQKSLEAPDRLKFADDTIDDKESAAAKAEVDHFEAFQKWLLDNGAEFPDLYLKRYTDNMRGVHASRPIESYSTVVAIPLKCLITDHMGRTETELGRLMFAPGTRCSFSTPNLIAVVVYMLTDMENPDSFFQPYYRILPSDYNQFPIFWSPAQLSLLEGSPVLRDIDDRKRNMRADYDEVVKACPEFARFTFDQFLNVRTAVGSRNFGIVVNGDKRTAMVPYSDMLNHYRPRETSWTFDNNRQCFTITALSALRADQQVMDSYGKKCNSKFLMHYGFAVENNREEDGKCQNELNTTFRLMSSSRDPLRATKESFLGASRAVRSFRASMNYEDKATADMLGYLRAVVADQRDLDIMMARGSPASRNVIRFQSPTNEAAMLDHAAEVMREKLAMYPTPYEKNLLALPGVKPFTIERSALIVVLGEQEIAAFWVWAAETLGPLLRTKDGAALQAALKMLPRGTFKENDLSRYASNIAAAMQRRLDEDAARAARIPARTVADSMAAASARRVASDGMGRSDNAPPTDSGNPQQVSAAAAGGGSLHPPVSPVTKPSNPS